MPTQTEAPTEGTSETQHPTSGSAIPAQSAQEGFRELVATLIKRKDVPLAHLSMEEVDGNHEDARISIMRSATHADAVRALNFHDQGFAGSADGPSKLRIQCVSDSRKSFRELHGDLVDRPSLLVGGGMLAFICGAVIVTCAYLLHL